MLSATCRAWRGTARVSRARRLCWNQLTQIGLLLAKTVKRLFDAHEALFVVPLDGHATWDNGYSLPSGGRQINVRV